MARFADRFIDHSVERLLDGMPDCMFDGMPGGLPGGLRDSAPGRAPDRQPAAAALRPLLCVSIHDCAPQTWPDCLCLLRAVRAVADIPLTLLLVPHYHGLGSRCSGFDYMLAELSAHGHELALHGYTHRDDAMPLRGAWDAFVRTVYTQGEGEFAALDAVQARMRIASGLHWFARHDWPVAGFVAPAWLLGAGAWRALQSFSFEYTTTMRHFYILPQRQALWSPSLFYAARNAGGRVLSQAAASVGAALQQHAPLVRLGLHPRDARHPALVRHAQRLLEGLLTSREAVTKAAFAARWRQACCGA